MKKTIIFQFTQVMFFLVLSTISSNIYDFGHDIMYLFYYVFLHGLIILSCSFVISIILPRNMLHKKATFYAINVLISLVGFNIINRNYIINYFTNENIVIDFSFILFCLTFIVSLLMAIFISHLIHKSEVTKDSSLL
jgi:hypothetical protein